jgi:hypothetical protein
MKVALINDGPVTIIIDTKNKVWTVAEDPKVKSMSFS